MEESDIFSHHAAALFTSPLFTDRKIYFFASSPEIDSWLFCRLTSTYPERHLLKFIYDVYVLSA